MEGEAEYAFWHVLARDVAYTSSPAPPAPPAMSRPPWIESKAADRVEDLADVLAYHYATALELARAAGQTDRRPSWKHRRCGSSASPANARSASTPPRPSRASSGRSRSPRRGTRDGPSALARFGEAALQAGRYGEATEALEEAVAPSRRGRCSRGRPGDGHARQCALPARGSARMDAAGGGGRAAGAARAGPELVGALTELARAETLQGRPRPGFGYADQALALAEQLGLEPPARALGFRGLARADLGDRGGLDDFREAIALATEAGQGREAAVLHNNLACCLWASRAPRHLWRFSARGSRSRRPAGSPRWSTHATGTCSTRSSTSASTTRRSSSPPSWPPHLEASATCATSSVSAALQARILALRGQAAEVADTLDWLETTGREAGRQHIIARPRHRRPRPRRARAERPAAALLTEIEANPGAREARTTPPPAAMVRTALTLGDRSSPSDSRPASSPAPPTTSTRSSRRTPPSPRPAATIQAAADGYADAAERWQPFGVVPEQAFALLGQGRCLLGLARPTEAAPSCPGPGDLRAARGGPRARRDRRAAPTDALSE